jgi:hypothetical protein
LYRHVKYQKYNFQKLPFFTKQWGLTAFLRRAYIKKFITQSNAIQMSKKKKILEATIIVLKVVHFGNKQCMGSGVN